MKKAKQILSLMLVIAMALGMMVFVPGTASAKNVGDYTDTDSIEYKEAVDVLSALGILLGDESGAFNPQSNITREQAAKIITYILIGTTSADRLAPRASSFTDVDTSRWSNPYIEYCVEKGIIKGYGDGRFGPADPVTAAQMAKMLLMCIGYGAVGEYDNPDNWELNTIVDGQKRGILTLDEDYTQPASREEVAQYTFNTLTGGDAFVVIYSELAKQYLTTGSSALLVQEKETTLGMETFKLAAEGVEDDFGRGMHYWYVDKISNKLTDEYISDVVIASFAAGNAHSRGSLFSSYKWPDSATAAIDVYVNGAYGVYQKSDFAVKGDSTVYPFPNGAYVELLDTDYDNTIDKAVVIYEVLAQVTKVNAYTGTINVQLYDFGQDQPSNEYGTTLIFAEGFEVDEYVLVVPAQSAVALSDAGALDLTPDYSISPLRVETAEVLQGELTAFTSTPNLPARYPTLTFDGKVYNVSAGLGYASASPTFGDATFYLDSNGNVIGFDAMSATAATRDYLYVSACQFDGITNFYASAAKVRVTYTDGTEAILNLPMSSNGKIAYGPNNTTIDLTATLPASNALNGWYSYTFNANGEVRLTKPLTGGTDTELATLGKAKGLTSNTTVDLEGGSAFVVLDDGLPTETSVRATSGTVLSVINNGVRKTYTGFANFPDYTGSKQLVVTGGSQILLVYTPGGTSLAAIYVVNGNIGVVGNYGILLGTESVQGDGVHYTVYVNGESRTIVDENTSTRFMGGTIVSVGDEDQLAAAVTDSVVTKVTGVVAYADPSYIQIYNSTTNRFEFYYYEADTQIAFNEVAMFADVAAFWTTGNKINSTTLRDYNITATLVADGDDTILAVSFLGSAKSGTGKTIVNKTLSATTATAKVGDSLASALSSITVDVIYSDATVDSIALSEYTLGDVSLIGGNPTPAAVFATPGVVQIFVFDSISYEVIGGWDDPAGAWATATPNTPIVITVDP